MTKRNMTEAEVRTGFDEACDLIEQLQATNKELHRRCQQAEAGRMAMADNMRYEEEVSRTKRQSNYIQKIQAELEHHRWIPVSERLPDDEVEVLALFNWMEELFVRQVDYTDTQHKWRNRNGDCLAVPPSHWKPIILPKGKINE